MTERDSVSDNNNNNKVVYMECYSPIKKKNKNDLVICNNMDGVGGYYVKLNKPSTERQTSHVLTHLWELKIKTIELTECRLMATRDWKGQWVGNGDGIQKYS